MTAASEPIDTVTDDESVAVWPDGTAIDINRVYPLVAKLRRENRALRAALRTTQEVSR